MLSYVRHRPVAPLPSRRPWTQQFGCVQRGQPQSKQTFYPNQEGCSSAGLGAMPAFCGLCALDRLAARLPLTLAMAVGCFCSRLPLLFPRGHQLEYLMARRRGPGPFFDGPMAASKGVARAAKRIPYSRTAGRCGRHPAAIGRRSAQLALHAPAGGAR